MDFTITVTLGYPMSTALRSPQIKPALGIGSVRQRALRESVFEMLLSAIVRGELRVGDWLKHQQLAESLEVSATPLREALHDLFSYGIVDIQHNCGAMVRPFGPAQLYELFYVRALLEADATRLACSRLDGGALKEIKKQTNDLLAGDRDPGNWEAKVVACDDNLHRLIADGCGNQRLKEEIFRYRSLLNCIRRTVADHHYPFRQALLEHLAIIEALCRQLPEEAAKGMTDHILSAAKICGNVMFPKTKAGL